ncbi:MAG: undecaprenyldiphospho-muramoylpentapeptide beta-N-acetylglucosaminyltransferase [Myxococcaceae bacterium]|nr:undecaprenyldiphospho-muramoylpentapeptide beta-N-acetylglucosaminyltransferase [Myxococcaceae bacterium]MBH2006322.1 undecaprenyldiphospho-muramoylpentapeptide beta-N-acetylglucosaminyltransferase [Myxococcaceae bacterium]
MKIVIAGGGTGGHVFPAIALAQGIKRLSAQHEVLFVGTEKGIEARTVPASGFRLQTIEISGFKEKGLLKAFVVFLRLPFSLFESIRILRQFRADGVVGVGGYASGPVLLAAWLLGIPRAILEQNSIPGFTNRMLAHFVSHIFGAFECLRAHFPARKLQLLGNPLRDSFRFQGREDPDSILILGGSLGARPLNVLLPPAMAQVGSIQVIHQTGALEREKVEQAYRELGVAAEVVSFISDMPLAYARAKLVIARSGAMTCSELTAMGVPAILIPFPQAADQHQLYNAQELAQAGAAIVMEQNSLNPETLAGLIKHLFLNTQTLETMAHKSRQLGKPNAADAIAKKVIEIC